MSKATSEAQAVSKRRLQIERRNSLRAPLVVRVAYQTVDELFSEFARNINEGGMFVETRTPPEPGASVDLHFRLPGCDEPVRVTGTVVRTSPGDDNEPPGMGIEFGDLDADTRQRINELVRSLRSA